MVSRIRYQDKKIQNLESCIHFHFLTVNCQLITAYCKLLLTFKIARRARRILYFYPDT